MLTPKQAAFVREFAVDRSGKYAAIRAGYSAHTAAEIARKLLKLPIIQQGLAEAEKRLQVKADMTVERVAKMLLDDREMARQLGQPSAAVTAAMGIAKLYGLIVDRTQNENRNIIVNELDDATLTRIASGGGAGIVEAQGGAGDPTRVH